MDIVSIFSNFINWLDGFMYSYILVFLLIAAGIFFTYKTRFVQLRLFKDMIASISAKTEDSEGKGVSSFSAFAISTASRVGTGNIAGVATAITAGGPGAVFWMWLIAIIGSATGFIESTLAQVYKVKDGDQFRGGPAYYIQKALHKKWLAVVFALLTAITYGVIFNQVQANTIASSFNTEISPLFIGIVLAVLTSIIIFGGLKRIATFASYLVPVMASVYLLIALIVIILNFNMLPSVFYQIFSNAFGVQEIAGGTLGYTIQYGIKRGLFSNEAGVGSVPNAAATAKALHPVNQGLVQAFGVFIDTLVICSATAFIILFTGVSLDGSVSGINLVSEALYVNFGQIGVIILQISVFLFAFSSIVGNYYYSQTNIQFVSKDNKIILGIFRIFTVLAIIIGSIATMQLVWNMADIFMGFMALINIGVLFCLYKTAIKCLDNYSNQKKSGKTPVFFDDEIEGLETDTWKRN